MSGGTKVNTPEATRQVVDALKKNIDFNEWKVYEVRWMEGEKLENNIQLVSVDMINKTNNCFTQSFLLSGPGAGPSELRNATGIGIRGLTFDTVNGITPEMIDETAVQKQYTDALAMIPEQYEFRSVGYYCISDSIPSGNKTFDRGKTFGKAKARFTVNIIEKRQRVCRKRRQKVDPILRRGLRRNARRFGRNGRIVRIRRTHERAGAEAPTLSCAALNSRGRPLGFSILFAIFAGS